VGGAPFAPEGDSFLSAVAKACARIARVLRPVPRHADAHWIERNDTTMVVAHFARDASELLYLFL
jgi:hypothetical protein